MINFNSTMVRFWVNYVNYPFAKDKISIPLWCGSEYPNRPAYAWSKSHFNSTMVRFWENFVHKCDLILQHFNSTMVRFWASSSMLTRSILSIFQFHYGAVLRHQPTRIHAHWEAISIPLWCGSEYYWSTAVTAGAPAPRVVTIHSEYYWSTAVTRHKLNFNSTMVRFWVFESQRAWLWWRISIPLWCGSEWYLRVIPPA